MHTNICICMYVLGHVVEQILVILPSLVYRNEVFFSKFSTNEAAYREGDVRANVSLSLLASSLNSDVCGLLLLLLL